MNQKKLPPTPAATESEHTEQATEPNSARIQAAAQIRWLQLIAENTAAALRRNPQSSEVD
jgi:hypothetical protein